MIERKNRIIASALELFANDGYTAVSTSKIAKHAEVSEGLIFRHFTNKQGLLDAILALAFEKTALLIAPVILENDPKEVIKKAILMPFSVIDEKETHFWKLQFKLKWELEITGREKTKPLLDKLTWAFEALHYPEPDKEAELVHHIIEGISTVMLKEGKETQVHMKDFLLEKYGL